MIVLDRPDLLISIELKPDPPDPAQYVELRVENRKLLLINYIRLMAAEANVLADALRVAATRGRLVK